MMNTIGRLSWQDKLSRAMSPDGKTKNLLSDVTKGISVFLVSRFCGDGFVFKEGMDVRNVPTNVEACRLLFDIDLRLIFHDEKHFLGLHTKNKSNPKRKPKIPLLYVIEMDI